MMDKQNEKRRVVVFDFDGTLTRKDTLLEFIRFACGTPRFIIGFILYSPLIALMFAKLYPNWKAKQKIFSFFFKGCERDVFVRKGKEFIHRIDSFIREDNVRLLDQYVADGATVYVVSASVVEWVRPWCQKHGAKQVLATEVVSSSGCLTGRFSTKNCYGQEKVNRLLAVEPNRSEYTLYAYGDSRGDKEMIEFADFGSYV
jgi:HAD superfamily hydrolase (TIGR01490 family)